MVQVVECEICGRRMGKKPNYTEEDRGGQICNNCYQGRNKSKIPENKFNPKRKCKICGNEWFAEETEPSNQCPKCKVKVGSNNEKGILGERMVKEVLQKLDLNPHHNNFKSAKKYSKNEEEGADIWNEHLYMEIKNWPHSFLGSEQYREKVKPRLEEVVGTKIAILIGKRYNENVVAQARSDGVHFVKIDGLDHKNDLRKKLKIVLMKRSYWRTIDPCTKRDNKPSTKYLLSPVNVLQLISVLLSGIKEYPPPKNPENPPLHQQSFSESLHRYEFPPGAKQKESKFGEFLSTKIGDFADRLKSIFQKVSKFLQGVAPSVNTNSANQKKTISQSFRHGGEKIDRNGRLCL